MATLCALCKNKRKIYSHGAFGEPESYPCPDCLNRSTTIAIILNVFDNGPEEHKLTDSQIKIIKEIL